MSALPIIPFFPYPALYAEAEAELAAAMQAVCLRGAFIMQQELVDFERAIAQMCGVKHCFGVADGTIALTLSLRAAGLQPGDEVLVPSHTFVASPASIHHAGGVPVLVDMQADRMINVAKLGASLTAKTRAVMPVQLNGRVADMDELAAFCAQHGLFIVEDSAQALGATYKGRSAGSFGRAGTFSFYPAKLLGCFGDGGAVITNDDAVAETVQALRDHGRNPRTGELDGFGYNARLDNLQAAIMLVKLKRYPAVLERRRAIARIYQAGLADLPEVVLPIGPDADPHRYDIYQNYEIEGERRDALKAHLEAEGIRTIMQWGGKMVHQHHKLGLRTGDLTRTQQFVERCLLLPMHPYLSDNEAERIVASVRRFYP